MRSIRLYKNIEDTTENNIADMSNSLIVNCVGIDNRDDNFKTYKPNGRNDFSLLYIQEGEIRLFKSDNTEHILKKGMGVFFHAHKKYHHTQKSKKVSMFWIHFTGSQALEMLNRFGFEHEFVFDIGYNESIINLFQKIIYEFIKRKYDFCYSASLYLSQILLYIKRSILTEGLSKIYSLEKSIEYIHNYFYKDFSIEQLAEIEQLSVSHYRKLFVKQMGISPKQYLTSIRIAYACDLLQGSKMSIKDVAIKSGYTDIGYFYRIFKKTQNLTPSHYRELNG